MISLSKICILFILSITYCSVNGFPQIHQNADAIVQELERSIHNISGKELKFTSCNTGNPIDDCWRCDPDWEKNRQKLANCGIGFGKFALGGKNGKIYVVTDSSDNPVNPPPGTLRYGVIQVEPLWIIFDRDMTIHLKEELMINSFKTLDGRGAEVHIANGPCLTIQFVSNIIIHGIHIHNCHPAGNALVRDSPSHYGWRTQSDGDAISIFGGSHIWIDHNTLTKCDDGLIDAVHGSTAITISNNYMHHHEKAMLFGHHDSFIKDKDMQVTIAFNRFGEGLNQRIPRCRHGYFHILNNDYTGWITYAIGGSANPTINSQGNRYVAPDNAFTKEISRREATPQSEWKKWNWRSVGDIMLNGAFFTPSGSVTSDAYAKASSSQVKSASLIDFLTASAGALSCVKGSMC